jgi:D-alanyl-D-alanine carboxypeptidase
MSIVLYCVAVLFAIFHIAAAPPAYHPAPVDSGFLRLVNAENPLPKSFTPKNLITHKGVRLHFAARDAFAQLLVEIEADGIHGLSLHSAYRSYSHQKTLFSQKEKSFTSQGFPKREAESLAARSVQRPGASEHQTGLALDVSTSYTLTQSFGETEAGRWLRANAHRFGFIIRYPQAKTHTTNIVYEPWHLRYVGVPHAAVMREYDLTLEEYAGFLAARPVFLFYENETERFLLQYMDALPVTPTRDVVDISSVRFGRDAHYIVTSRFHHPLLR